MKKDEQFVITINRELGSGGRTVGEKLAKKLDVPFYDKALVKALEKEYHLTVEEIERLKGQKDNWWTDFKRKVMPFDETAKAQYYKIGNDGQPELITSEAMFKTESRLLEEIASAESCVIAGRSGFYVFRKHPNHLSILIQAPMESRIKRIMGKKPITKNYVNKFTGTSRYDTRNYDLVINMDGKTEEEAVDLILKYIG